ncbi:hypothetical protein A2954_00120 [Candidatus Roizmanbacteria bacterium RIFCSPLOWO2_01_FULL_37_12]|uniref:Uncharacterized protein n=1 Tax=Candidatus Roizmanbacteria bacterium RIFCSPLOWO2_01_FULL_37_12 TaxID=1802056 RepID=A0A1F7I9H1_9BACT|nr:MAG: hypothetical protein A3D76_01625 [Candidatus Roizmanbacteria bacterium RIFCSPHIGHO2_02_FULL_37_9b]OGK40013.1 MAG: hypothetical protein A2954_00115 [Candidatus Roizmanbacteria bacterium RIFCSPLOWO2_01_FULL_37_12]OGK40014.1 MAG: hypothetical protein A2954_00120 [Candidatus Roizmanbacteria bacterium RIFCSPLOWO2_01_FULL_37_12]
MEAKNSKVNQWRHSQINRKNLPIYFFTGVSLFAIACQFIATRVQAVETSIPSPSQPAHTATYEPSPTNTGLPMMTVDPQDGMNPFIRGTATAQYENPDVVDELLAKLPEGFYENSYVISVGNHGNCTSLRVSGEVIEENIDDEGRDGVLEGYLTALHCAENYEANQIFEDQYLPVELNQVDAYNRGEAPFSVRALTWTPAWGDYKYNDAIYDAAIVYVYNDTQDVEGEEQLGYGVQNIGGGGCDPNSNTYMEVVFPSGAGVYHSQIKEPFGEMTEPFFYSYLDDPDTTYIGVDALGVGTDGESGASAVESNPESKSYGDVCYLDVAHDVEYQFSTYSPLPSKVVFKSVFFNTYEKAKAFVLRNLIATNTPTTTP